MVAAQAAPPGGPARRNTMPKVNPSDYPKEGTCSTCTYFFMFLLVQPLSIVFFYHAAPTTVVTLNVIWVLITLAPWAFHAGGAVASDVSGPLLTVILFFSNNLAFLDGVRTYYSDAQPLRQLMLSREYKGVYPELPAIAFPDASYLEFAGNATVDVSKAVSYQSLDSGLSIFCAAPVTTGSSTGRYDFWAIGVDCCGKDGKKFECHDAAVPGVKTGWVLPNKLGDKLFENLGRYVAPSEERRDIFVEALRKAEAVHGLTTPGEKTVFLRWLKADKKTILQWQIIKVSIELVLSVVWMVVVSLIATRLYQRFIHVRKIQRMQHHFGLHGEVANSEDEDVTARLQQFMADTLEGGKGSDMAGSINRLGKMVQKENLDRYRPPLSAADMCLMGVLVPYVLLMLCMILSTFAPCANYGALILAPFWCFTLVLIMALLATPNRAISGLFILMCCTVGYYIGNANYKTNMFHYCSTGDRRMYKNVPADSNTDIFWDAGMLKFDQSTHLSTEHSVGFLYQGTSYCAAPVISKNAPCKDTYPAAASLAVPQVNTSFLQLGASQLLNPAADVSSAYAMEGDADANVHANFPPAFMQRKSASHRSHRALALAGRAQTHHRSLMKHSGFGCTKPAPAQIEFWAIGVDCCDARKKFWCDGGEIADAREAVVVRAFGDEGSEGPKIRSDRQHFFQAIDQAVAAYSLPEPDRPVLLRWGTNAMELRSDWRKRAIGIILMTAIASLLIILAIFIASYFFMRQQRRLEKKNMEEYEARTGGNALEPSSYPDSPRPSLPPAQSAGNLPMPSEDELRFPR